MDLFAEASDAVARSHGIPLPDELEGLYEAETEPVIGGIEFLPLDALSGTQARSRGMCPYFVPLAVDDSGTFGLLAPRLGGPGRCLVAHWLDEYDTYLPVSSSMAGFLASAVDLAWYESVDSDGPDPQGRPELSRLRSLGPLRSLLAPFDRPASTELELAQRALQIDPASPWRLCDRAHAEWVAGQPDLARDMLGRSRRHLGWFGDASVIEGIIEDEDGHEDRAWLAYSSAVAGLVFLTTNSALYDLGPSRVETDLLQLAAERLLTPVAGSAACVWPDSPLRDLILSPNPFGVSERLEAAAVYERDGDLGAAERERLNALALACTRRETDAAYEALARHYEQAGCIREHTLVLADAELDD